MVRGPRCPRGSGPLFWYDRADGQHRTTACSVLNQSSKDMVPTPCNWATHSQEPWSALEGASATLMMASVTSHSKGSDRARLCTNQESTPPTSVECDPHLVTTPSTGPGGVGSISFRGHNSSFSHLWMEGGDGEAAPQVTLGSRWQQGGLRRQCELSLGPSARSVGHRAVHPGPCLSLLGSSSLGHQRPRSYFLP